MMDLRARTMNEAECRQALRDDPNRYVAQITVEFVKLQTVVNRPEGFQRNLVFKDAEDATEYVEAMARDNQEKNHA